MGKIVRYNGGTISIYGCSEPKELVVGKLYEVVDIDKRDWQTNYSLKGVDGYFNSVWFDDVAFSTKTFIALAREVPTVGTKMECTKIELCDDQIKLIRCITTPVVHVVELGNNTYLACTRNSIYVVQVR